MSSSGNSVLRNILAIILFAVVVPMPGAAAPEKWGFTNNTYRVRYRLDRRPGPTVVARVPRGQGLPLDFSVLPVKSAKKLRILK